MRLKNWITCRKYFSSSYDLAPPPPPSPLPSASWLSCSVILCVAMQSSLLTEEGGGGGDGRSQIIQRCPLEQCIHIRFFSLWYYFHCNVHHAIMHRETDICLHVSTSSINLHLCILSNLYQGYFFTQ
jgi:hypothetical protein